jgi:hypothetical protein
MILSGKDIALKLKDPGGALVLLEEIFGTC